MYVFFFLNAFYYFPFRSSYTQRILEIISNIEKQKRDINKNLQDTRIVQKEINSLDGKVERCFISIDDLMFKVFKTVVINKPFIS